MEAWFRAHPDYSTPLELSHWSYLAALVPVLTGLKAASKRLEADTYITGSKALKVFKVLRSFLSDQRNGDNKGPGSAIVPMCFDFLCKLDGALNDPTRIRQMTFLAFMDPSGGCIGCITWMYWSSCHSFPNYVVLTNDAHGVQCLTLSVR